MRWNKKLFILSVCAIRGYGFIGETAVYAYYIEYILLFKHMYMFYIFYINS